jgi:enamine deaminase RidA (YjgF/YER057c/UK114 family)
MHSGVTYVNPPGACPAQGLYSHVSVVPGGSELVFVAGQLAVGTDGEVVGAGDFAQQFQQVYQNLGDVLRGIDAGWDDITQFRTYLVSPDDIAPFMTERADLFPKLFSTSDYPPNTLLIVSRLVKAEFLLEVEAVVARPAISAPKGEQ